MFVRHGRYLRRRSRGPKCSICVSHVLYRQHRPVTVVDSIKGKPSVDGERLTTSCGGSILERKSSLMLILKRSAFLLATTTTIPFATTNIKAVRAMSTSSTNTSSSNNKLKTGGALIFLHGLGDSPAGWSSLANRLPQIQPRLANIQYIFPAAPTIPIAINGNGTCYVI
jgi:Phospholipase/Carboxylesterase